MKGMDLSVAGARSFGENNDRLSVSKILSESLYPMHRLGDVPAAIDESVALYAQYSRDRGKPATQLAFGDKPHGMVTKGRHDYHDIDDALMVCENHEPVGVVAIVEVDLQSKSREAMRDRKESARSEGYVTIHNAPRVRNARGDAYLIEEIPPYQLGNNETQK